MGYQHTQKKKLTKLISKYLPEEGVLWLGSTDDLFQLLEVLIGQMPDEVQSIMRKYYLDDNGPEQDQAGRARETRFYQKLMEGRTAIITTIKTVKNYPEEVQKLLDMYRVPIA